MSVLQHVGLGVSVMAIAAAAIACPLPALAQSSASPDPLLEGFRDPPPPARPRTWWHWTGGNITD